MQERRSILNQFAMTSQLIKFQMLAILLHQRKLIIHFHILILNLYIAKFVVCKAFPDELTTENKTQ